MTAAAKSLYYFGLYLYLAGATLIFIPNVFLSILGLPETNEAWIRIVGILTLVIGFYYHGTSLLNHRAYFKVR